MNYCCFLRALSLESVCIEQKRKISTSGVQSILALSWDSLPDVSLKENLSGNNSLPMWVRWICNAVPVCYLKLSHVLQRSCPRFGKHLSEWAWVTSCLSLICPLTVLSHSSSWTVNCSHMRFLILLWVPSAKPHAWCRSLVWANEDVSSLAMHSPRWPTGCVCMN